MTCWLCQYDFIFVNETLIHDLAYMSCHIKSGSCASTPSVPSWEKPSTLSHSIFFMCLLFHDIKFSVFLPYSTRACGRQWRMRTRWLSRACCPETTSAVAWGEEGACGRERIGKRRIGWKRGREGSTGWVTRVWFPSMLLPLPTIPLCSTCWQRQEQDIIPFVSEASGGKNAAVLNEML